MFALIGDPDDTLGHWTLALQKYAKKMDEICRKRSADLIDALMNLIATDRRHFAKLDPMNDNLQ